MRDIHDGASYTSSLKGSLDRIAIRKNHAMVRTLPLGCRDVKRVAQWLNIELGVCSIGCSPACRLRKSDSSLMRALFLIFARLKHLCRTCTK